MAIKRRPTDEDDEERPRRKRRKDEDDEIEEAEDDRPRRRRSRVEDDEDDDDDDRPSKRRRARAEDEEDEEGEDRPRKRRKPSDEDEEDDEDDRPAKRRRSRDEDEEDEEQDEDRPRKRRKPKDEDEDENEDADDAPPKKGAKKPEEKTAKPGPAKPDFDDGEAEYAAWQKKKVALRKQFLAIQSGLNQFNKRISMFISCLSGLIGTCLMAGLMGDMLGEIILYLVYLMLALVGIVPPLLGIQAAAKCRQGPSKFNGEKYLGFETIISIVIMVMFLIGVACLFVFKPEPNPGALPNQPAPPLSEAAKSDAEFQLWGSLASLGLGYAAYMVSFINELLFFQTFARFMKDKISLPRAAAAITHFIKFAFIAVPIFGTADYFLHFSSMGKLGDALAGVLTIAWLIMIFKGFMDTRRIIEALSLCITKKLTAEDKPNW